MKSKLEFIDIKRIWRNQEITSSSLGFGGRGDLPGVLHVIGGLEHNVGIAPKTEADRLKWIAFLESDACKERCREKTALEK